LLPLSLLGGLSVDAFLRDHWQKKPLLVRQALPGFEGFLKKDDLVHLAMKPGVSGRVVVDHGAGLVPRFTTRNDLERLAQEKIPARDWTLLVQNIEAWHPEGWPLLRHFMDIIPLSRLGDLMVSVARPGGSVGPHKDAYDVFLLQGRGRRTWQISETSDPADRQDIDVDDEDESTVRTVKRFTSTSEWVLEPGDMLYLPPGVPHWGVAVDECLTYSIGFTTPMHEQLVQNYLAYLSNAIPESDAIYQDPDLTAQADPGALSDDTLAKVKKILTAIQLDDNAIAAYAGRLLTGRSEDVVFEKPRKALDGGNFKKALSTTLQPPAATTLALAGPTRVLHRGAAIYVNGEELKASAKGQKLWSTLAKDRQVKLPVEVDNHDAAGLHELYREGAVVLR